MSAALFNRSPDLKRLCDEGYQIGVQDGNLVMRDVPYLNARGEVKFGTIISPLCLAGDVTQRPQPHTVHFEGEFPCDARGNPLKHISAGSAVPPNLHAVAKHYLSTKPPSGQYDDYHQKMTTYASIISSQAATVDATVSARKVWQASPDDESVFHYVENASGRAGIEKLTALLAKEKIAIVGVGGTGSYVLDLLAKTPVQEIRLVDNDEFLQHNAFRAPGAPSLDQLLAVPKKVDYFQRIYNNMRRGITAHAVALDAQSIHLLDGITFTFLCMDAGQAKQVAIERLEALGVPFIDVGMGLDLSDGTLGGILRVTLSIPSERQLARQKISLEEHNGENIYASNIQVADLNALNAALAVIRWKRYLGFYRDLEQELHSLYTVDGNCLTLGGTNAAA